jgi:hypothetical protein
VRLELAKQTVRHAAVRHAGVHGLDWAGSIISKQRRALDEFHGRIVPVSGAVEYERQPHKREEKIDLLPMKATSEESRSDPNSTRQDRTRERLKGLHQSLLLADRRKLFALARLSLAGSFSRALALTCTYICGGRPASRLFFLQDRVERMHILRFWCSC